MALYWRGKIDLENAILKIFFEKAPANLRRHSLSFIGRSLLNTKEEIPAAMLERLTTLWESRLRTVTSSVSSNLEELSSFGWWFASAKFDSSWGLNQLLLALESAGQIEADHQVINRLKDLSVEFPELTVECLTLISGSKDVPLVFLAWPEQVQDILHSAINSASHPAAKKPSA